MATLGEGLDIPVPFLGYMIIMIGGKNVKRNSLSDITRIIKGT